MLKRKLTEHLAECFFSGEKLNSCMWNLLTTREGQTTSTGTYAQQIFHSLVESLENRYPREHRLTDVRLLVSQTCTDALFSTPELPWLDDLYNQLMIRKNSIISYHENEVNAYVKLAAGLDPTLLVGWHLAQWITETPQPDPISIVRTVTQQTSFFAPTGNSERSFAEGHVHLGGATTDDAVLGDIIFLNKQIADTKSKKLHWYNDEVSKLKILVEKAQAILASVIKTESGAKLELGEHSNPMEDKTRLTDWELIHKNNSHAASTESNWLLSQLAQAINLRSKNTWLWLQLFLCRRYQETSTHPTQRIAILCFWQVINILRRTLIMDSQGLARFAERYYRAPLKTKPFDNQNRIDRLWGGENDLVELKSNPEAFKPELAAELTQYLCSLAKTPLPKPPYIFGECEVKLDNEIKSTFNKWQYCGHFIRSGFANKDKRDSKKIWKTAEKIVRNLSSSIGWNRPEFLGGKLNPNFDFKPAKWFRGLDVAGDENEHKIEWFAPALRWLRSDVLASKQTLNINKSFHFSIHAGEDYAHPVSGMRHIDETVKFCDMYDGDRLGHALALGIEPQLWIERQGEMILSVDEHLDNLVWLWHYCSLLSGTISVAQKAQPLLTRRIERFWNECRWWQEPDLMRSKSLATSSSKFEKPELSSVTNDELFYAWQLRRNCFYHWTEVQNSGLFEKKDKLALPDYEKLADPNNVATKLYLARHKWLALGANDKLVIVRQGEAHDACNIASKSGTAAFLEDIETPVELEFMHALQDWLLNEYNNQGLIIETNPTSNVYIARLNDYTEHPIFRWNPPESSALEAGGKANRYGLRRGPMKVLINTDDPGIMPTTLRTEYALLHDAALKLKVGHTDAENWLKDIRKFGVEQFHRNHLDIFDG